MVIIRFEPLVYLQVHGLPELSKEFHALLEPDEQFDPDWEKYERMENADSLRFVAVRDNEALVGFAAVEVIDDIHYFGKMIAIVRDVYLTKEKRGHAVKLIKFIEVHLSNIGASRLTIAERPNFDPERVSKLFSHLGFKTMETWWSKNLETVS